MYSKILFFQSYQKIEGYHNKEIHPALIPDLEGKFAKNSAENKVLEAVLKQKSEVPSNYLNQYIKFTISFRDFKEAADTMVQYKCPISSANLAAYRTLALAILDEAELKDADLLAFKQMMIQVCNNLKSQGEPSESAIYSEFYQFAMIFHLELLKSECKALKLQKCYTSICISLLRYTKKIRVDKAFLDAGLACRDAKQEGMASLLLNRYMSLYEAIEYDDIAADLIENYDFNQTDIPLDTPLPKKNLLTAAKFDEVRDWVMKIFCDNKTELKLSQRWCDQCKDRIYEACLTCPNCKKGCEPCIASGYPLTKSGVVYCKSCQKGALKEFWTEYVKASQHCPWCKNEQSAL